MKTHWLDRKLIVGPYLTLVLSDAEFQKAMDDCGQPKNGRPAWISNDQSDATAHTLENATGEMCCIVALRLQPDVSGVQVAGLLVHEAVHAFQRFCCSIGETDPSSEFEAYSIQAISQALLQAFADRQEAA